LKELNKNHFKFTFSNSHVKVNFQIWIGLNDGYNLLAKLVIISKNQIKNTYLGETI